MKILITGFEPFGEDQINVSYEAVKRLPDMLGDTRIIKLELPTVFSKSIEVLEDAVIKYQPEAIICVGQAGSRACVSLERVAVNLADARIPDNEGQQPQDQPIHADGPAAYFSTLPVRAIAKQLENADILWELSYSAGTYVCNCVMYHALYMASHKYPQMRAGFIHVPYAAELTPEKPKSMPLAQIVKSLECAAAVCADTIAADI